MGKKRMHAVPIPHQAPSYRECAQCGFLCEEPKPGACTPCPNCGSTCDHRRVYPSDRLRRLDSRIRGYEREGEAEIVVILSAAFLEAILEDIIDRMLEVHGADLALRRMVLDTQRAIGARIVKVFPALAGEPFEMVTRELGFEDFPGRWRALREARNAFIHDSPFQGPRERIDRDMAADAMRLLDQAYELFVAINNRFALAEPDSDAC